MASSACSSTPKHRAGKLALVEYSDGVIVTLLDDRPVGSSWTATQLEQAVIVFIQLQRQLESEAATQRADA